MSSRIAGSALLALAIAATATAAQAPLTIVARGGTSACIDIAALRANVADRLGTDPFAEASAPRVLVELQADGESLAARVTLVDLSGRPLGERRLRAASCAELGESLGLVLSMALVRDVSPATPPPLGPPHLVRETPVKAPSPGVFWLGLGASPVAKATPTLAIKSTLGIERRWRSLTLGLEASLVLPVGRAAVLNGSFEEQLLLAAAVPCLRRSIFGACAVLTAGAARVQGFGYTAAGVSVNPYAALGVRGQADWPLSARLALRLDVEILAPVVGPSASLGLSQLLWRQPAVSGELGVTLLARLE